MNDVPAASDGARALLGRLAPMRVRAFSSLDPLAKSVRKITSRWPDMVSAPADQDRETLALNMLHRVRTWSWDKITTQKVISAALAVFDDERRMRPDLEPVRSFYLAELETRGPGPFLDGMARVYLDSFVPGALHTHRLAEGLRKRAADLGGRYRRLVDTLPTLFQPEAAPRDLASVMVGAEHPYEALKSIGISSPHTSGLTRAAHKIFVERLAPDLARPDARAKLFNWLAPEAGPVLEVGAGAAIEAVLAVWKNRTPPDALRNELTERIIGCWNDPRLHAGGIWPGFDPDLKSILLRWLTHQDMKFFCDVVTATQPSHMWPPRRDFWLQLYDDGKIDEAWVAFDTDALQYARRHLVKTEGTDMSRRFGRQKDRGGKTSLLIMRIGNRIVVDGCHSYRTHIFRIDDRQAPKLYQREYHCDEIMRQSKVWKAHNSIENWSQWVHQNV
ncbi:hypothetical protein GWI72_05350 [Microvirga tunisiensis]|uniref:Zorya protein ZorC EH domain-containing protein n=1 Tax=Pannonibacter tanglangensis TaxID=2750084 RepID=A0A7X5F0T7_9HYPH|nr:EH signature domain-containing protein [Pannonibacter sp. XCT-53]NBN77692.1 hypothetical protein [Pannonibacter sp. XCT-53]